MKASILALLITLITPAHALAHQHMVQDGTHPAAKSFTAGEAAYMDPSVVDTKYLEVKAMKIEGFSGSGKVKLEQAFEVLEKIVNSEEFKEKIVNFKNAKGQRAFASNKGLSNERIYEIFMEGRETLQQKTPGEMNFFLKLYNGWWSKVVGWTNEDINTININSKFFKNYKPNEVAGNLAHEWTHKLGFDHISAAEHDSAPYAIGYIVEKMTAQYLSGQLTLH